MARRVAKSYIFHTSILDLTGGSKSVLLIAGGLVELGCKVNILLEKNLVRYPIPKGVGLYLITLTGVRHLPVIHGSFGDDTMVAGGLLERWKARAKLAILSFLPLRWTLIWVRYLFYLILFPARNIAVRRFLAEHQPDVVVSSNMYFCLEHLDPYRRRSRLYMSVRNSPQNVYRERITPRMRSVASYYDGVTCIGVSEAATREMAEFVDLTRTRLLTIYNPFDFDDIRRLASQEVEEPYRSGDFVVVVGSLVDRKRVDLALRCVADPRFAGLRVLVLGVGPERGWLEALAGELGLGERAVFLGARSNPYPYMARARALLLTSSSEGLPRVVIESLICGTPVVSTDCPTGPAEIMVGELAKFLVPIHGHNDDFIIHGLRSALENLLKSPPKIDDESLTRFSDECVIREWLKL